jgi:ATP-binding cassette, subfamily B (MDR/TAP), member 1
VAFFDRLGAGEVTNRVSNDAEMIREGISDKVSVVISSLAAFFSAFIIAFVKNWKFALILSCIVPTIMAIFGVGTVFIAKYTTIQLKEYGAASTIAEEIISSVKTAQAFGSQKTLTKLYDQNLIAAQRAGYRLQLSNTIVLAVMFFSVYAFYGLGFCTIAASKAF